MIERLDALALPLWGSRLIEASAGTGKTWTIAAMYLRLVLGHGEAGQAFTRPLAPAEILVMTYTRAATRELSDRIRARLLEAARCFRGDAVPQDDDVFLRTLVEAYPEGEHRNQAAWRLANAAEAMDDAAVLTIDAWCQRMLREHAFDSLSLFDEELVADDRSILEEAARDYWRQQMYPLAGAALETALDIWPSADHLVADVLALLGRGEARDDELPPLGELVEQLAGQRRAAIESLKRGWPERARAMSEWLAQQLGSTTCPFNRQKLQSKRYTPWLDSLSRWAQEPSLSAPDLSSSARSRLRPSGMQDALKPGARVDLPDHFEAFETLMDSLAELPDLQVPIRLHAATCVARRVIELKSRAGAFGFIDLQERLASALEGPNARRLRERIVEQYPVTLVDEFQDTSPRQYRIFECLYRPADNDAATALFLIGDPKQSIYGFRGADIYSYLRARRATLGRHYMLDTNHRSTEALVAAVNRLFSQAEARPGGGAFLFRAQANPLPFEAVRARGRRDRMLSTHGAVPALTFCHDAQSRDAATSRQHFAALAAQAIVTLLNDDQAGFDDPAKGFTQLRPADIAVLVRTGREATTVRTELRRRGVPSVYLSDQDSVFATPEAKDVLWWLRAVANPADARLARAAYATSLSSLTIDELSRLAVDEEAWEQCLEDLRSLRGVWLRQGVLTMLRLMLQRQGLPARWLAEPDGERRLTNVLHIAELLQAASLQHDGEHALQRWLIEQISNAATAADDRIVRLESDADLVQVITVHKSKGLEFPVVFLPFAGRFRAADKRRGFIEGVDAEGKRSLDFKMSDDAVQRADRERLREDLRLLYVALTRARHALWLGVAPKDLHRSALGHLLSGGDPIEAEQIAARLDAARGDCPAIVLQAAAPVAGITLHRSRGALPELPPAPVYAGTFERDWTIGSFSTLVRDTPPAVAVSFASMRNDETSDNVLEAPARVLVNQPWHRFPRGALPGNFLHGQLQWLAEERFGQPDFASLQDRLRRRCEQQGWGHRQDDVAAWLQAVTTLVLPPVGTSLQALASSSRLLPEMEFWLPSERLYARQVDALCRRHLLAGRERPALPQRQLHGMLMGFADLVFEHAGRYWVLDYKSNALGPDDAAYHQEALAAALLGHRYDVQGALYLLALHRLLRARLGARYQPLHHLGGALFFFIRGIHGPEAGCQTLPADLELLDALDQAIEPAGGRS